MAVSAGMALLSTGVGVATGTIVATSFSVFGATLIGAAATSFLVTTALGTALNALTPKPRAPSGIGTDSPSRGYQVTQTGSALDQQIIYGKVRAAGVRIFDGTTGSENEHLHRVIAFTGHEIESFDEIYINDAKVTSLGETRVEYTVVLGAFDGTLITGERSLSLTSSQGYSDGQDINEQQFLSLGGTLAPGEFSYLYGKMVLGGNVKEVELPNGTRSNLYDGKIKITKHLGSPNQSADSALVSEVSGWTSAHRLRGISYLYIKYTFDADVFPNGVPEVTATIKGKKVYDPRNGSTYWSDNPALCLRDYLTNTSYGLGEDSSNVDDSKVIAAANICDQTNTPTGSTRFTCNGSFTTGSTPYDTLSTLLTSMGGLLWYAQGEWRMKPAYWTAPVLTLDEDDLRGSLSVNTRHSRRDNYNTVRGTFRGSESNWQITDYPEVSNSAFLSTDNGQESVIDLSLPFTDNSVEARRIANVSLERNRQQLTFSASFGMRAFQLQVGDNVKITNSRFGWSEKAFEVTSWTFGLVEGLDLQVEMVLREISENVFDDISDGNIYERDNTNLPDPFYTPPVGFSTEQSLRIINEQVSGVISVDITSSSLFAVSYIVQYKAASESSWSNVGTGLSGLYEIYVISDGQYNIRVRSVSTLGIHGDWVYRTIDFKVFAIPPQDVVDFSGNVIGSSLHLTWSPVTDLDLSYYKVRYSAETSGATYSNSVDLVDKVARPANSVVVPAQTGTYFIKAVDKVGGLSVNPNSFVVLIDSNNVEDFNAVATLTENPTFSGTRSDVVVLLDDESDYLALDTSSKLDGATGDFDEALGLFDGGNGDIVPSGVYYFSNSIDLGEKYTSRVRPTFKVDYLDYVNDFESATGNFDDREGNFDGDPDQFDTTSASFELRHTDDDPSGTPSWSDWQRFIVADISARAIEFRVVMTSKSTSATPAVRELSAEIDMPERTESQQDIVFTGSKAVTFPSAFKDIPALGVSLANLADGDRYVITNKTRSGFTITVLNAGVTSTSPVTLDYVARGYGKELT